MESLSCARVLCFTWFLLHPSLAFADPPTALPAIVAWRPLPRVTLTLNNPSPIIGISGDAELRIDVSEEPDFPLSLPRVLTSAGEIQDLQQIDRRVFTARFVLPKSRYPQSAILMAEFSHPAAPLRGWLAVRLSAAAEPLFHTDPGAKVTLWVGDKEFGPHVAPPNGAVRIPIVVPPGFDHAVARSVNHFGKMTEHILDLRVPYSQRMLLVSPEHLAAGGLAEVAAFAVDHRGSPAPMQQISLETIPPTKIRPLGGRVPGEARFLVQAPTLLAAQNIQFISKLGSQTTTQVKTTVPLSPTTVAGLSLVAEQDRLDPSPGAARKVFLSASDGYGNSISVLEASVLVDGISTKIHSSTWGIPFIVVQTPTDARQNPVVVVEAVLRGQSRKLTLLVDNPPQVPKPELSAQTLHPHYTLTPRLGFLWNLGHAVGASIFVEGIWHRSQKAPDFGLGLSLGVVSTWFASQDDRGIAHTSLTTAPLLLLLSQRYQRQRWFIGASAGLGLALSIASTTAYHDYRLTGYAGGGAALGTLETGVFLPHAHLVFSLRYLVVYLGELSNQDRIRGNAGGAILDFGYRWVW